MKKFVFSTPERPFTGRRVGAFFFAGTVTGGKEKAGGMERGGGA
jgi:hypothetical protein